MYYVFIVLSDVRVYFRRGRYWFLNRLVMLYVLVMSEGVYIVKLGGFKVEGG